MGKKSTPKAPPAPDYAAAATAQGTANLDAARIGAELTNTNQYTPYGNQVFTKSPDSDQWSSTISLSPEQQHLYDLQTQGQTALGETATAQLDRVKDSMSEPLDISGAPARVNSIDSANYSLYSGTGPQYERAASAPSYQNLGQGPQYGQIGTGPGMERVGSAPSMSGVGSAPNMSGVGSAAASERMGAGPDMSRLGSGPEYARYTQDIANLPDYAQQAQEVEDSLYRSATTRLDPQFQQQENAERQRLINAGVAEDSEMYRNSMDTFNRNKQAAYGDARDRAIQGRGAEQSRLNNDFYTGNAQKFGQTMDSLGFNNDSAARQYADSQNTAGFNNAASQQEYQNRLTGAGFNNSANQQDLQNNLATTGFNNAAGQQNFQNNVTSTGFNNAAGQQNFQNNITGAGFNNAAGQQEFANRAAGTTADNAAAQQGFQDQAASTGFNNANIAQQYADALRSGEFNNNVSGQEFEDTLRSLGFNNQAEAQQFLDSIAGGNFQNTQRGAAIDEASFLRNDPLNMYNALATGAQVTNPTFRGTGQVQGPAAAPVFAGVQAADQRATDIYNAQLAQAGSASSGLFGALGTLGGAALGNWGSIFGGGK